MENNIETIKKQKKKELDKSEKSQRDYYVIVWIFNFQEKDYPEILTRKNRKEQTIISGKYNSLDYV